MRRIVLGAIIAIASKMAKDILCTGTLIDVDIDPRMNFPYAVVYDSENYRTCMLDRGRAGHDPLRGLCNVGETCTISGPYKRQIRDTYILNFDDRGVHVEAPEGSPLRQEELKIDFAPRGWGKKMLGFDAPMGLRKNCEKFSCWI